ncbi:hypothetical protein TNCV_743461 [Trichonephila clavipes]|nr:hypothetical protein TNCV_743461 [Trichonephila clavipes]
MWDSRRKCPLSTGKITKADILTEENHSIKCLHVCIVISEHDSRRSNLHNAGRRRLTLTVNIEERFL